MKNLLLMFVVLAVAAPLYARENDIKFTITDNWDGSCTIAYDVNELPVDPCDEAPARPVAMGLNIKVISGPNIKSIEFSEDDPCGIKFFDLFMDHAYSRETDPCDPCVYCYGCDSGTALADPCGPGEVTLTTHGNHFVISMGGLGGEIAKTKEPPRSGSITLKADVGATPITGRIKLDARRGGVIGETGVAMEVDGLGNGAAKAGPTAFTISECYREADAVAQWYPVGKPVCWCYARQCRGDADGDKEGNLLGWFYVGTDDINILAAGWRVKENPKGPGIQSISYQTSKYLVPGACSDHGHAKEGNLLGWFYVGTVDIDILAYYWRVKEPPKGPGVPVCEWGGGTVEIDPRTGQPGTGP